jgi:transcriptional regulator with XRE-family HTH domain
MVEPSTLHRLVEGGVQEPRIGTLRKLADAFGVPIGYLLGDISADAAQGPSSPLPEPYWLIQSFHRRRQETTRNWLRKVSGVPSHEREFLIDFLDFKFSPLGADFPIPGVQHLVEPIGNPTSHQIGIVRRFAEMESELIEAAAERLKSMNPKVSR